MVGGPRETAAIAPTRLSYQATTKLKVIALSLNGLAVFFDARFADLEREEGCAVFASPFPASDSPILAFDIYLAVVVWVFLALLVLGREEDAFVIVVVFHCVV